MDVQFIVQLLLNGVIVGVIYALIAMGLSLIFGVLEIVNFAHGEFYMLGAVATYFLSTRFGFNYWGAVVTVTVVAMALGYVLYETLLAALRGQSFERSILLTLGLSMVLQNGAIALLGTTPKMMPASAVAQRSIAFGGLLEGVQVSSPRLVALAFGMVAFGSLYFTLYRTQLGRAMRGVAQSRDAALMVGIDPRAVARLAVMIGIGLSGLAGAALAPVYAVHPLMGFSFVFKAFAIIIIGGLGNVSGAAIAAVVLGIVESLIGGFLPQVLADGFVFCAMIAILLVRPHGLFGRGVRV